MSKRSGVVAWMLILAVVGSCSWFSTNAKKVETNIIDCTVAEVQAKVPELFPVVVAILAGNGADWEAMLAALAKSFGEDVVACTVKQAGEIAKGAEDPAAAKARTYLEHRKAVFK